MNVLLLSGLGPSWPQGSAFYDSNMLNNTFLEEDVYHKGMDKVLSRDDFIILKDDGTEIPLFRYRNGIEKNLTSLTLSEILSYCNCNFLSVDLENVWNNKSNISNIDPDYIFLSTTFICNMQDLAYAIKWCEKNYSNIPIVLGGQYSNLKYEKILNNFDQVKYVMRGDGEISIPLLIKYLNGEIKDIRDVSNLVYRDGNNIVPNKLEMINMDEIPVVHIDGKIDNLYYETVRGCAFRCKFCSFPNASPKWRYKSADKIVDDWEYYKQNNDVKRIRAMDSAFTFPPDRLNRIMERLKNNDIEWEAYSRAEVLNSKEMVENLEASKCRLLSIGFESLSDNTLKKMNKRISAEQNHRANELLINYSDNLDFRGSFIVGFPGETREDYELTKEFLINDFKKQFHLSVFSLVDETMPIWSEADKYNLKVMDMNNPDYYWSHNGMDSIEAHKLHDQTLRDVRWKNEIGVATEWQLPYDLPLNPYLKFDKNYRIEKLIERLAFVNKDFANDPYKTFEITNSIIDELESYDIYIKGHNYKKEENKKRIIKRNEKYY